METEVAVTGPTTYFISNREVPSPRELPWRDDECDAFVAILDAGLLTSELARELSLGIVRLRTDWIETMGKNAEFLHDLIDETSVSIGRQRRVGDGNPMTAWHEDLSTLEGMIDYLRLGGHGASDNKLVIVIGPSQSASLFADKLRSAV